MHNPPSDIADDPRALAEAAAEAMYSRDRGSQALGMQIVAVRPGYARVFPTQIEELILREPKLASHYQLVVSRDGYLDQLEVNVELRPEVSGRLSDGDIAVLGDELCHFVKSYIGVTVEVHVLETEKIERTVVGKAKRVIDKRPKG